MSCLGTRWVNNNALINMLLDLETQCSGATETVNPRDTVSKLLNIIGSRKSRFYLPRLPAPFKYNTQYSSLTWLRGMA